MRAIRFGPRETPEPYGVEDVPEPVPGPGRLLVRTECVGLSLGLVRMLRDGTVPAGGPGGEMVGRVAALGPGVTGYRVGERVGGVVFEGVHAEAVLAAPELIGPVPEDVPAAEALAVVRGGLVALGALRAARPVAGESMLVTAAASGVGHLAVQLATAFGAARVVAAVGSADKADFVRGLGADEVVTYAQDSWGEPVDVVLEAVGGEVVQRGVDALAPYGRLVALGAGGGGIDAGSLLGGLKSVTGFSMGLMARQEPRRLAAYRAELWNLLRAGRLRPAVTALPLEQFGRGVELIASRRSTGRVLLDTGAAV